MFLRSSAFEEARQLIENWLLRIYHRSFKHSQAARKSGLRANSADNPLLTNKMAPQLKRFLLQWIIGTLAVLVASHVVKGIHYDTPSSLLVATLLLGILNTFVRPLLTLLS